MKYTIYCFEIGDPLRTSYRLNSNLIYLWIKYVKFSVEMFVFSRIEVGFKFFGKIIILVSIIIGGFGKPFGVSHS